MSRIAPTHRTRRRTRTRGQSLVEFAVVLPVFLLVLAGIVDFGLGLYSQMTVINATREGARLGIVLGSDGLSGSDITQITTRITAMSGGLDISQLKVLPTCADSTGNPISCSSVTSADPALGPCKAPEGCSVTITVDYPYKMIWPLAFGNTLNLSSAVKMRIE